MKYRESFDGISVTQFLYSNTSKLAVIKNFREEALGLAKGYTPDQVKKGALVHLKDFTDPEQFKYLFKLSNLPMNPTMLKQQS
jgi:hypothetical protein